MVKEWGGHRICIWAESHGWKHRHLSKCWTNESHIIPAQLEEKCWSEHFSFLCLWFPWPRETVLKQTHLILLITVVSALERKEMRYSVLWSQSEGFGALWSKLDSAKEGEWSIKWPPSVYSAPKFSLVPVARWWEWSPLNEEDSKESKKCEK